MRTFVITGGPCTGKTSVVNELQGRGYSVMDEIAREVISKNPRISMLEKQILLGLRQEEEEEKRRTGTENLFLDRGIVDVAAYSLFYLGYSPVELSHLKFEKRYDLVFLLDKVPYKTDSQRRESEFEAGLLHEKIRETYVQYGYDIIAVPAFPPEILMGSDLEKEKLAIGKRVDYILGHTQQHKTTQEEDNHGRMLRHRVRV